MRRSILIVMLDVMVLSVLALTAGKRGGNENNIPVPLYRWSTVVEEGLRKEQAYQDEVARLEEQLARSAELAEQALRQAEEARAAAGRERSGSQEMQQRVHEMELAAEKARSAAALAERERELAEREQKLAQQTAEEARQQAEEFERLRAEAEQQSTQAQVKARTLQAEAATAESALEQAEREAAETAAKIAEMEAKLAQMESLKAAEAAAKERARTLEEERARLAAEQQRLAQQNEQYAEKLAVLSGEVAALEVQKQGAEQTAAQLEQEKQIAEAESKKSVWIRRDESLCRVNISYTEYNSGNRRDVVTERELMMPLVKVGRTVLVPADFRKLGLARSFFFGGLSDAVSQVGGTVRSVAGDGAALPLDSIVVPGAEPQVCLIRFAGTQEGALESISMETLKERRIKDALLFSPDDVNEHGRVEIVPVIGSDYVAVEPASGNKPKVGDYLLTDRGEFIGVMVTKEHCYVMPQVLSRTPPVIMIPIASRNQDSVYFKEFIRSLNLARERVDAHLRKREF